MKKPHKILLGDSRERLERMRDNRFDSIVTDPPYELGFMGKTWDNRGISFDPTWWAECLRVLKPGGYLVAFGGSRTWHRIAVAIEDAGFEIRDTLMWIYGSGFPKSLDVSKAIDKELGVSRKVVGTKRGVKAHPETGRNDMPGKAVGVRQQSVMIDVSVPASPEAQRFDGYGTALKPAVEPIILARKPLDGTVAKNVLKWGTGGLNIDGTRIGVDGGGTHCTNRDEQGKCRGHAAGSAWATHHGNESNGGRWPANVILGCACEGEHDADCPVRMMDEQSGMSGTPSSVTRGSSDSKHGTGNRSGEIQRWPAQGDFGGASRFFYVAKAGRLERELGLLDLEPVRREDVTGRQEGSAGQEHARSGMTVRGKIRNTHPTVKPLSLMQWLVRLVTPPDGLILDPFVGSGTTVVAAKIEGFRAIGIDQDARYVEIARAAINVPKLRRMKKLAEAHREERIEHGGKKFVSLFDA